MPVIEHYEAQHKVAEVGLRSLLQPPFSDRFAMSDR
jgi:hypothetical protein